MLIATCNCSTQYLQLNSASLANNPLGCVAIYTIITAALNYWEEVFRFRAEWATRLEPGKQPIDPHSPASTGIMREEKPPKRTLMVKAKKRVRDSDWARDKSLGVAFICLCCWIKDCRQMLSWTCCCWTVSNISWFAKLSCVVALAWCLAVLTKLSTC